MTRGVHDDQNLVRPRQVQILLTNSISTDGNIPLRLFVHDVSILLTTLASIRLPCSSGEVQQTEVDLLPGRCFQRPMLRLGPASETRLDRTGQMHRIFGHRHQTRSILLHHWNTENNRVEWKQQKVKKCRHMFYGLSGCLAMLYAYVACVRCPQYMLPADAAYFVRNASVNCICCPCMFPAYVDLPAYVS